MSLKSEVTLTTVWTNLAPEIFTHFISIGILGNQGLMSLKVRCHLELRLAGRTHVGLVTCVRAEVNLNRLTDYCMDKPGT